MDETVPYGKITSVGDLGAVVRAKRRQLGLTQEAAAALAGVGTRFLSELERGKSTCELGRGLRVLARMGIDVSLSPRGER
jgi:HTH-type transcriptional regulator/antitoxin HipB